MEIAPLVSLLVHVRTVSEANRASSEHWRYRWKRSKEQHVAVTWALLRAAPQVRQAARYPLRVHLVRLAPGKLDSDNLSGSQKHTRDSVAKFLGVDDGDEARVSWSYAQEHAKTYAVRIELHRRET